MGRGKGRRKGRGEERRGGKWGGGRVGEEEG